MTRSASLAGLLAVIFTLFLATAPTISASPATAAAKTAAPFNLTVTAAPNVALGCCYLRIGIAPTLATFPRIGRATVSGYIEWCGVTFYSPCPERNGTTLSLLFSTPSGDTLTLAGYNPIGDSPITWRVSDGTGRFAGASGAGTYTYDILPDGTSWVTKVQLSGTFRMR